MNFVKDAGSQPLLHLDRMTPDGVMRYITRLQANQRTGKYLSASSYNGKRSAIHHRVRVHWGKGQRAWSEEFNNTLDFLWKGFTRHATKEKATAPAKSAKKRRRRAKRKHAELEEDGGNDMGMEEHDGNDSEDEDDNDVLSDDEDEDANDCMSNDEVDIEDEDDDRDENQVGKSPMTPELYKNVCRWFLEWGSTEGIFCACFFAFTWQLACRSNNTARIRYGHISWVFLCNARVVSTHQNAAEESMLLQPFRMV